MIGTTRGPISERRLFLKLSAILVPVFLLLAGAGMAMLTQRLIDKASEQLGTRIGASAAQVAAELERAADGIDTAPARAAYADGLLQILISDPAVACVALRDLADGRLIAEASTQVGCVGAIPETELHLPVLYPGNADLIVYSSFEEIEKLQHFYRELAVLILGGALVSALITSWIAFQIFIGRPLRALLSETDTARQHAEHSALHDSLTGLANRRFLDRTLAALIRRANSGTAPFALLHIDLDRFKSVNDLAGHAAGDAVLVHVAEQLCASVRGTDFVARVGGDEFVVLAPGLSDPVEAGALAGRAIAAVSAPVDFRGSTCSVGASVGVAIVPAPPDTHATSDRVLSDADAALYRAKEEGRGRHVIFDAPLAADLAATRQMNEALQRAVRNGEIVPHYQSQHDPATGQILGLEALARWDHPERGLLLPEAFMGVAQRMGLVAQIDEQILTAALADLARWDRAGIFRGTLSVNVSLDRLNDPALVRTLRRMSLPAGRLIFEINQSALLDTVPQRIRWTLDTLAELGIAIEVDDFGTGKASVVGVKAVGPVRVKIARELVAPVPDDPDQVRVLEGIVALGRALNVGLTACGVASRAHFNALRDMGFDRLQGHHFAPATDAEAMTRALRIAAVHEIPNDARTGT